MLADPPNFAWTNTLDAPRGITISGIATDTSGNPYIGGRFWGRAKIGDTKLASEGGSDIFLAKLKPSGEFVWVSHRGTTDSETLHRIGVDGTGNCYACGQVSDPSGYAQAFFLMKYDREGHQLWVNPAKRCLKDLSWNLGWSSYSVGSDQYFFTVDHKGYSFLVTAPGGIAIAPGDVPEVTAVGPDGIERWTTRLGDRPGVIKAVRGITGRRSGGAVIIGQFTDTVKIGGKALIPGKDLDFFVVSLDSTGAVQWVEQSESRGLAFASALAVGVDDSVVVFATFTAETTFGDKTLKPGMPALVKYDRNGKISRAASISATQSEWARITSYSLEVAIGDLRVGDSDETFALMTQSASTVSGSVVRFAPDSRLLWSCMQLDKPQSMAVGSNNTVFLSSTKGHDGAWESAVISLPVSTTALKPVNEEKTGATVQGKSTSVPQPPPSESRSIVAKPNVTFNELIAGLKDADLFATYRRDYQQPYDLAWETLMKFVALDYKPTEFEADKSTGALVTISKEFLAYLGADYSYHRQFAILLERTGERTCRINFVCCSYEDLHKGSVTLTVKNRRNSHDKSWLNGFEKRMNKGSR